MRLSALLLGHLQLGLCGPYLQLELLHQQRRVPSLLGRILELAQLQ
jgi:hypothetical protein